MIYSGGEDLARIVNVAPKLTLPAELLTISTQNDRFGLFPA